MEHIDLKHWKFSALEPSWCTCVGAERRAGSTSLPFSIPTVVELNSVYLKYSVMQLDQNTLKLNVVITKFYRCHYRIFWAPNWIWNPWSKCILSYYFQNMSKRVVVGSRKVVVLQTCSDMTASQWVSGSVSMSDRHWLLVFI